MIHIIPNGEGHIEDSTCKCFPRIKEVNGEMICIHQSFEARELIDEGFHIGAKANVKSRCGRDLIEGDIIESVQGNRFMVLTIQGLIGKLMNREKHLFDLEDYMTPNIFYIGNVVDDLKLRHDFFYSPV